jgi:large subunit ribosomal protein L25
MSSRFVLLRTVLPSLGRRSFSSLGLKLDPSRLVHGVTKERMERDPELTEFMRANFPEAFDEGEGNQQEELNVNIAELMGEDPKLVEEYKSVSEKRSKAIAYARNIRPLTTYFRDPVREDGTRNSKKLRYHEGLIPGLLYGGNPSLGIFSHQPGSKIFVKTPWRFLQSELDRYHRSFESRVYDLTVLESPDDDSGGTVHRVTPQNVQRHPVMSTIYCANYLRYHPGRPLKLPVNFINQEESVALKRDGFIVPIQRYVECFIDEGVDIPESMDVECTGLQVRDVIRTERLIVPEGVRFSDRVKKRGNEFILGVVYGKGKGDDEEETKEAPKETAAKESAKDTTKESGSTASKK